MATPSLGFQNWFSTTLSSGITASDTTIYLNSLPTPSEGYLVLEPDSTSNREIIYYTSKGANYVTLPSVGAGRGVGGTTAVSHSSGVTVQMNVVAEHFEALQDGTSITDSIINPYKIVGSSEIIADHVASGCVWSGDAYASTRVASMTSGVVYISGKRLTVASVTSRTFTASKDVYVDLKDNGDGTAVPVYYDNTTNAASPSFATTTGTMRIAIVVVGASNIAAASSINQGQPDRVLPIASSIPYAVTDSLGQLICNRTPDPTLIGYRQITSSFTSTTTPGYADVTGLSTPVIVPTGRKIKISIKASRVGSSGNVALAFAIREGSTVIDQNILVVNNSNVSPYLDVIITPTAGLHTYIVSVAQNGAGTMNVNGGNYSSATTDGLATIKVELV